MTPQILPSAYFHSVGTPLCRFNRRTESNMSQILLITSSPRVGSYSTRVGRKLAQRLASRPASHLTVRDLTREPLAHIDDSFAAAHNTPPDLLTSAQKSALSLSDKLLAELFDADTII